jgi:hypothetical protein
MRLLASLLMICALASPAGAQEHHDHGGGDARHDGGGEGHEWHGGGGGDWHGGWNWGRPDFGGYHSNDFGAAVVGGALGSVLGNWLNPPAVVVVPQVQMPVVVMPQAAPTLQPWTPDWYTYCAQKFKSFDPHTGEFVGFDGKPYFCN